MFGFLGKVKDFVSQNVEGITTKIKTEFNDLIEENKKLEEKAKQEEEKEQTTKFPWETIKIVNNSNGNIRDIIKEEILELSMSEENFLTEESSYMFEFDFNLEEYAFQAIKLMEYDPKLGNLRNDLVPGKISEEKFWKNYFYNVEMIRMKHALKAEEEAEIGLEMPDEDDVLQPEEKEDYKPTTQQKKAQKKPENNKTEEEENNSTQDKSRENETENPDFEIKL